MASAPLRKLNKDWKLGCAQQWRKTDLVKKRADFLVLTMFVIVTNTRQISESLKNVIYSSHHLCFLRDILFCLFPFWLTHCLLTWDEVIDFINCWFSTCLKVYTGHYYTALVLQGQGTTKFTNLIGWNGYWQRSRFSHQDRHLDR